jgi:hypothetical protein
MMSYSHEKVVKWFAEGVTDKRGSSVFSEGDTLYSHGRHFSLAIRREGRSNLKTKQDWFLLNGDKYSVSTSAHQSMTFDAFKDYPRVAFSAIRAAGIDPKSCRVVDWWQDASDSAFPGDSSWDTFKESIPPGATYYEHKVNGEITQKGYHRIGSAVLRSNGRDYLCSMDEGSYFVSKLPRRVSDVKEAFESLVPEMVSAAKAEGLDVPRQGEWFFIPRGRTVHGVVKARMAARYALPARTDRSNRHVATRGLGLKGNHYVVGFIRHRTPSWIDREGKVRDMRSREHRTVKLDRGIIYQAVRNTSRGDWSASGRVD